MTSFSPPQPVSRNERSHCPTQTVKKLLEEQRRRQQQPDAGAVPIQFSPPLTQPLTPSVNEAEAGHTHFPTIQETVGSGIGTLAPPTSFPDWDPNTHAAYTDSPCSYPASAAEGFLNPEFYQPSDSGRSCAFSLGMEDPLDTRLYAEPSLSQAESWRVSGPPSVPPPLLPSTGPSLETARAHMLALGPQQLLAQDEEGDTLLHLFAAWGLRWAAYAAAEVLQMYGHLDIREHKGKTPLLVAAAANQPLIVEDLLNLGAEPNATDHQGRSVLHVAATYGLPGVLSAVFKSGVQVDLEARDFEGLTPLHTAILALNVAMRPPSLCPRTLSTQARDRLNCVQMLLHMGADHTSQEIKSNKTVLHLAVQAANPTLVQLLLELPRGDLRAFVNMKAHGNTALHMAAALPPGPPQEAIVRHLLAAGADPTLRNLENEQPVHLLRPGPGPERVSTAPDHRGTPSTDPVLTLEGDFKSQKMTFNPYPTPTSKCDLQCQYLVLSVHMRPGSDFLSNPDLSTPNLDLNVPFDLSVDPLNSCP
ncbi:NF-kappa-B inhibitor delta isoform X1 [Marmota marmota marmota]|uniref:NF-kappa-B inhibitor delta isoform X1 n=2 Tax=Marmota marmota marmota TaxID=9994 RepID=UPI002093067F|nr:NF-kappa-B inhibitor delta isoform X1 [Marmota marmota marmota]